MSIMRNKMARPLLLAATLLLLSLGVRAQEENRVAVVVSLGDGEVVSSCVAFSEPEITGFEALNRTGFPVELDTVGLGTTVCSVDGSGCPGSDCWCQCKGGGDCLYWSYWHQQDGEWRYSQIGSGSYQVSDGDVEGWVWGVGSPNEAPAPPPLTFEDVCQPDGAAEPQVEAVAAVETEQQGVEPTVPPSPEPQHAGSSPLPEEPSLLGYGVMGVVLLGFGGLMLASYRRKNR